MRITKIELENITSLKGYHSIDFDHISSHSDLFAITGPTGSGKSTILTAISMALYGEHPKGINAADMVSTSCPKGSIKLFFSKGSDKYEVSWGCQTLKKDGTPRKTPLTTRVLNENGSISERAIDDIIGLTFSQFSKVVILNQGQFSEFLSSSFTQRKDLLEKLLEHHDLKTLAPFLKKKIKEIKEELESLEVQGSNTLLLSKEELKGAQDQLAHISEERNKLKEQYNFISEVHRTIKETIDLSKNFQSNTQNINKEKVDIEVLVEELSKSKELLQKKQKHLIASEKEYKEKAPLIERAKELNQQKASHTSKIQEIRERLEKTGNRLSSISDEIHKKREEQKAFSTEKQELENKQKIKLTLKELESLKAYLEEKQVIEEGLLKLDESIKYFEDEKIKIGEKAATIKEEIATIKEWFNEKFKDVLTKEIRDNGLEASLEFLKKKNQQKREDQAQLKQLEVSQSALNEQITDITSDITAKLQAKEKNQIFTREHEKTLKELTNFCEKERQELELLELVSLSYQHLSSQHATSSKKASESETNQDSSCPVCETTLSPENIESLIQKLSLKLETESYDKKAKKVNDLESKMSDINSQLISSTTTQQSLTKELDTLNGKKQGLLAKEKELKYSLQETQESLKSSGFIDEEILESARKEFVKCNTLESTLTQYREQWTSQQGQIEKLSTQKKDLKEKIETLKTQAQTSFSQELQNLDIINSHIELIKRVDSIDSQLIHNKEIQENLQQSFKDLKEEQIVLQEALKESEKMILAIENEFSAKALPSSPEKQLAQLNEAIEAARNDYEEWRKGTLEKEVLYEKKNAQINILKEQLAGTEELLKRYLINLKGTLEKDHDLLNEISDREDRNFKKYLEKTIDFDYKDNEKLAALQEFFEEELSRVLHQLETLQSEKSREAIIIETRISENAKQQEKLSKILEQKQWLETQLSELEELGPYLLKDSFRDFALEVLEENLLSMANLEISSLADGRYELVHGKAGKRSELLVRDLWQGNNLRKVSTLSGGETFLLSLGLALGLSELTRGQTEVESFFIDEGFGTLDEESIGQVLGCLMQMQSRGKQIGIISHVRALTDQIPVRIELEKNNFGESQISIR